MKKSQRALLLAVSLFLSTALVVLSLAFAQGTGDLSRITTVSASDRANRDPDISADGTKIVFSSDSDFLSQGIPFNQLEIWLYDTISKDLIRITFASDPSRDSEKPRISADGTKIVFSSNSDFLGQGITNTQTEIWLYDTSSMDFTRVTTAPGSNGKSLYPHINADGTKIVFQSNSDLLGQGITVTQPEIWLYDTDSMTLTRVTESDRASSYPDITDDGMKVVFHSDSDFLGHGILDDQYEIWLYDTDSMTVTRITTAPDSDRWGSTFPHISADGTKIVFVSTLDFLSQSIPDNQYEIWLYDTDSRVLTRVSNASEGNRDSYEPGINADGTKIVFQSDSDFLGQGILDDQYEIWLYNTNSMTLTRITTASDSNRHSSRPEINAAGTKIVFVSTSDLLGQGIPDNQREIWLKNLSYEVYLPLIQKNYCGPDDDADDTPSCATGPIVSGQAYEGYPNDTKDYYSIVLSESGSIHVTLSNYQGGDGQLILRNELLTVITSDGSGGSEMSVSASGLAPGRYYVQVFTSSGFNSTEVYRLTATFP